MQLFVAIMFSFDIAFQGFFRLQKHCQRKGAKQGRKEKDISHAVIACKFMAEPHYWEAATAQDYEN